MSDLRFIEAIQIVVGLDVDDWGSVDQISARDVDCARLQVDFVQFCQREPNRVISVRTSRSKHSFFLPLQFWGCDFRFHGIVVVQAHVEDEYEPNVRVIRKPIQTTRVDLVHQRQPCSSIFDEA